MNEKGHPETLRAAHPGNLNAVKSGVYSERLIEPRAAEIAASLREQMALDAAGELIVEEVARVKAVTERIDHELDRGGIVDKRGRDRYLLPRRVSLSKRLSDLMVQLDDARERSHRAGIEQPAPYADDPAFQKRYQQRVKALEEARKIGIERSFEDRIMAAEMGVDVPGTA